MGDAVVDSKSPVKAKPEKRSKKKAALPKKSQQEALSDTVMDDFEDRNLTHYLQKEIRLDNGYYSVHEQELEEVLQSLNQTLKNAAVTITADEDTVLRITVNLDKFRTITQRKAGRKKKRTNILLEEMNEYRKTHTAMETAQWLGLTKQTYYRKLREHQKANHDGSVEF